MTAQQTILLTAVFAGSACSLVGIFLVLRRMAMMADAISHAILPGLVAAYVLANGPNLLAGIAGAGAAGLLTVVLVEALQRSGRVKSDGAIGIVFPALFALGTLVISRWFSNVHLDADAILYGEIAFSPFDRLIIGGYDLGSQPLLVLAALTAINLALLLLFFKELKLATFDPGLAAALGFSPVVIHYGLMAAVSATTVGGFAAVGAILVVALMIVPAATAYLLTDRLGWMVAIAVTIGAGSGVVGYQIAWTLDVSISGMIAVVMGVAFALAATFSPSHGVVARAIRRGRQREQFAAEVLLLHLNHHSAGAESLTRLEVELDWPAARLGAAARRIENARLVTEAAGELRLTDAGRAEAARIASGLGVAGGD
ncbi:MAG TPA: metal ABC transporter permease [Thermomicrobiales bacterium]|nr:metal ABC transporter permease [Thermomicrobiales bacterium]